MLRSCQVILRDVNNVPKTKQLQNNEEECLKFSGVDTEKLPDRLLEECLKVPVVSIEKLQIGIKEKNLKSSRPSKIDEKTLKFPIVCLEKLREEHEVKNTFRVENWNEKIKFFKIPTVEIEKLYWCKQCRRNFKSNRQLQDHIDTEDGKHYFDKEEDENDGNEESEEIDVLESSSNFDSEEDFFDSTQFQRNASHNEEEKENDKVNEEEEEEEEEGEKEEKEDVEIDIEGSSDEDFSESSQIQNQRYDSNDTLYPSETEVLREQNEIQTSQEEEIFLKTSQDWKNSWNDPLLYENGDIEEIEIMKNSSEESFPMSPQNQISILYNFSQSQKENAKVENTKNPSKSSQNWRNNSVDPLQSLTENKSNDKIEIKKQRREKNISNSPRRQSRLKDPFLSLSKNDNDADEEEEEEQEETFANSPREANFSNSPRKQRNIFKDPLQSLIESEKTEIRKQREDKFSNSRQSRWINFKDPLQSLLENEENDKIETRTQGEKQFFYSPESRRMKFKDPLQSLIENEVNEIKFKKSSRVKAILNSLRNRLKNSLLSFSENEEAVNEEDEEEEEERFTNSFQSRNWRNIFKDPLQDLIENEDNEEAEIRKRYSIPYSLRDRKSRPKYSQLSTSENEEEEEEVGKEKEKKKETEKLKEEEKRKQKEKEKQKQKEKQKEEKQKQKEKQKEAEKEEKEESKIRKQANFISQKNINLENSHISLSDNEVVVEINNSLFTCDMCLMDFNEKQSLELHVQKHLDEKIYNCGKCGKKFIELSILKIHMAFHKNDNCFPDCNLREEIDDAPYKCNICDVNVSTERILKSHLLGHFGVKPFECHICLQRLSSKPALLSHLTIHKNEKPFSCDICSKSFRKLDYVKFHKRVHMVKRPYECNVCDRTFSRSHDLKKHMFYHTGLKIYQCFHCNEGFSRKKTLSEHLFLAHENAMLENCAQSIDNYSVQKISVDENLKEMNFNFSKSMNLSMNIDSEVQEEYYLPPKKKLRVSSYRMDLKRGFNFLSVNESSENIDATIQERRQKKSGTPNWNFQRDLRRRMNINFKNGANSNIHETQKKKMETSIVNVNSISELEFLKMNFHSQIDSNANIDSNFQERFQESRNEEMETLIINVNSISEAEVDFSSQIKSKENVESNIQEEPKETVEAAIINVNSISEVDFSKGNFYPQVEADENIDSNIQEEPREKMEAAIINVNSISEVDFSKGNFYPQVESNENSDSIIQEKPSARMEFSEIKFASQLDRNENIASNIRENLQDPRKEQMETSIVNVHSISELHSRKNSASIALLLETVNEKSPIINSNPKFDLQEKFHFVISQNETMDSNRILNNNLNNQRNSSKTKMNGLEKKTKKLGKNADVHSGKSLVCDICEKHFQRQSNLTCHKRLHFSENKIKYFKCNFCYLVFKERSRLYQHEVNYHKLQRKDDKLLINNQMVNKENGDLEFEAKEIGIEIA